jgi:hypothetical protein
MVVLRMRRLHVLVLRLVLGVRGWMRLQLCVVVVLLLLHQLLHLLVLELLQLLQVLLLLLLRGRRRVVLAAMLSHCQHELLLLSVHRRVLGCEGRSEGIECAWLGAWTQAAAGSGETQAAHSTAQQGRQQRPCPCCRLQQRVQPSTTTNAAAASQQQRQQLLPVQLPLLLLAGLHARSLAQQHHHGRQAQVPAAAAA